ncbi:MAG: CCA tRNA nucleotidyltransferase [Chloroflexi bacterium]|nr:CCA tRNA nucleotidyltransferase [Chloroflexota bacterium]
MPRENRGPRLSGKLLDLARVFARNGKELYLVGGSVRDALLGRQHGDIDFATSAIPAEVKALVSEVKPTTIYTVGERFGTIGAVLDGTVVEITTYRSERYRPYSRKPEVEFGTSLEGDLSRRDFTVNAMAQNPVSGEIVDPFGGMGDLRAGLIKAVGIAEERFSEDPLRLLRAIRFATQLGFDIFPGTALAIERISRKILMVSKERIAEEMNKVLRSPVPSRGIRLMVDLDLMEFIIPQIPALRGTPQSEPHHKDVYEHTLMVLDKSPADPRARWAALLHDIAKPVTKEIVNGEVHFYGHDVIGAEMARDIMTKLRLDRNTIDVVTKLISMHQRVNLYDSDWTDGAVRRLIRDAGEELPLLLSLSRADVTSRRPRKVEFALSQLAELEGRARQLIEEEKVHQITSPLDGNDLMQEFGRPPGPWIREVKDYLLSLVLDGQLGPDDKERARELAREFVARKGV